MREAGPKPCLFSSVVKVDYLFSMYTYSEASFESLL